jgi:hypothetical protein
VAQNEDQRQTLVNSVMNLARGSVVDKALCYKPEAFRFEAR